ncbi:MAG TPA: hypothetical protein VJ732_12780 [Bryobacteraceae bacterium]|nr:hypothetical protein [Bryobacteraceae bacterium]
MSRYYRLDTERLHAVSTEITGYTVSTLLHLYEGTHEDAYLDRALAAARFLTRRAWDGFALPFETEPGPEGLLTYFFDCGIVVRGLLGAWRATGVQEFLDAGAAIGKAMAHDFDSRRGDYHPVLEVAGKRPVERDPLRWSRSPGCYQLKAAMAWWDLFDATRDRRFCEPYERVLEASVRGYGAFLPGHPERARVVDRLHAFLYFLEGLLPRAGDKRYSAILCDGIRQVAWHAAESAPEFERSDVYAQLLRIRIYADWAGAVPLDPEAARREAAILAEFQAGGADPRVDGGFYFGRRAGEWLPFINPVSTAFGTQALALWEQFQDGGPAAHPRQLI